MQLFSLFTLLAAVIASVDAATIGHDKVQPFPQPEPVTVSEKAAIKFKPQLVLGSGCMPYPAVNAAGETSGGLKGTGKSNGKCKGSGLGSQVYGRAAWHRNLWAIMYAWYFPKDRTEQLFYNLSHRHDWASIVVWIDNPAVEYPRVLGVSTMGAVLSLYKKHTPPDSESMDGMSPKVCNVRSRIENNLHGVTMCNVPGELQDLIMWEQLTDAARTALNTTNFGNGYDLEVPFIDANFANYLNQAWPY